jgi:tRNA G18 (ribose-2'-O)-methylase SpoU
VGLVVHAAVTSYRVAGPDDPRLAPYRDLRDATLRRAAGLFAVESRLLVRRLLEGGRFRVRSVLLTDAMLEDLGPLLAGVADVLVAEHATIRTVVGFNFHRGCMALAERAPGPTLDEVLAAAPRTVVVGEQLADHDNVGALLRNAWAFGADAALLGPGSADPFSRKAIRVSAGAALALPAVALADWPRDLARLRGAGLAVLALVAAPDAVPLDALGRDRALPPRIALLAGNEGEGLSPGALAAADLAVTIPMRAGVDSLNVAVATGIALHHLASRR